MKRISTLNKFFGMLALVAMMVCTFAICVSAGSVSDIKDSMVVVVDEDSDRYATGIAIGEKGKPVRYILTTYKVAEWNQQNALVYFSFANDSHANGEVIYTDPEKSLCIIELPKDNEDLVPAVFCPGDKIDVDGVFSVMCHPGNLTTPWEKNPDKFVNVRATISDEGRINNMTLFQLEMDATKTTLGAPIVNENGEVIAINLDNMGELAGYGLISDEAIEVLDEADVPYETAGQISTMLIIIIVAVAVAVIIVVLVIVLVVSSKKKKNAQFEAPSTGEFSNATVGYEAVQQPVQNAPAAPSMRVIALGGVLNGKKFNVSGSVKIGRDATSCEIAYPVNTQGVSGKHCELTFDGTVCYLKDLKSSYGTFLADGTKLAPLAPQMLRSGDKFYLAGPENLFEIRF